MILTNDSVVRLQAQISSLEGKLVDLKTQLSYAEASLNRTQIDSQNISQTQEISHPPVKPVNYKGKTFESLVDHLELASHEQLGDSWELTAEEYKRYGRQLIMPEIGLRGASALRKVLPGLVLRP